MLTHLPKLITAFLATVLAFSATNALADSDVSTMAGQLVKVGDRHQYRYSYRKWNVSTNPFSMIAGTYGVSASYAVGANVAVRGDFNYSDGLADSDKGLEMGISAPIYFRKVYDDWFIEPGLLLQQSRRRAYDAEGNLLATDQLVTGYGPQVTLGHHWMFDSGLNFAWGLGMGRNWAKDRGDVIDSDFLNVGYLRFGYAF